jgi:hypothetical protein
LDYKSFAFFTNNGVGVSGLTVLCDVYSGSGIASSDLPSIDIGGGLYSCNYSASVDDDYLFLFRTISVVDQNEIAALYSDKTIVPTGVWSYTTRTLTSFGTLISDIWNYITRTLTSGGGGGSTASEIWNYPTRTLTQIYTKEGVQPPMYSNITLYTNSTGLFSVSGIPDDPEIWFTMKPQSMLADSESTIQITRTGNLLYVNGKTPEDYGLTSTDGTLTYLTSASSVSIYISAKAAPLLFGNLTNSFQGEIKTRSSGSIVTVATQFDIDVKVALTKAI